ncbi:diaminopimelate epimerase [Fontisphaera persica]|uniref:diaminopimelate epimerase n=1 Tax=Fontisphaera persica TaxID=2974023 RepID=UPI0024C05FD7|nr:diaminopimelate epimerase [Fontisphaera persica]WCJ59514.1 diaminopimelate epimerase [Fontisphaera persica]
MSPRMRLNFWKMNGAGNDFVLADNRQQNLCLTPEQVARLCHRQRGIGADGLILWVPCRSGRADWAWQFWNSDGSVAEMCGNGARCFARFVQRHTGAQGAITFETLAGVITARFRGEQVTIGLTAPQGLQLHQALETSVGKVVCHSVNTGVPHAVIFVPDADRARVSELGPQIRHHAAYAPKGTNVNFVQTLGPGSIRVRTYERGVEGETLACGTGVTASALIAARLHHFSSPIQVRVQGGDVLEVGFREENGQFTDVTLTGPADFVFEGTIEL